MNTSIFDIISEISDFLSKTFSDIDLWFEKDHELTKYRPLNGGWSIGQILEHIALTNHFLLILIDKGTRKALQNASKIDVQASLKDYVFQRDQLTEIGIHQSFTWIRPEHMEPTGMKNLQEVRQQLKDQVNQCFNCLDVLKNGEGILYKTTMTVNGLGKIDVYEYIYFLAQHGQRHITQMMKNEQEFRNQTQ